MKFEAKKVKNREEESKESVEYMEKEYSKVTKSKENDERIWGWRGKMNQHEKMIKSVRRSNLKSICGPYRLKNQLNFSLLIQTMLAVFVQELFHGMSISDSLGSA